MFTLAWHIVAIGIVVVIVWSLAYQRGVATGERRERRRLEQSAQGEPPSAA